MPRFSLTIAALVLLLASGTLAACGDDDEQPGTPRASQTQEAFLQAMIPHHAAAIDMASVATQRAQHSETKKLASAITSSQSREIAQIERIHKRLFGSDVTPDPDAAKQLGLSADEAGMGHEDATAMLQEARPFDKAFIDEMVPHHLGAIRMARAVLETAKDAEITRLAHAIIEAQEREVSQMRRWRTKWYGAAAPKSDWEEHGGGHSG